MKEFNVYQIGYYQGGGEGEWRLYCKEKPEETDLKKTRAEIEKKVLEILKSSNERNPEKIIKFIEKELKAIGFCRLRGVKNSTATIHPSRKTSFTVA